jgi:hypothetical protein
MPDEQRRRAEEVRKQSEQFRDWHYRTSKQEADKFWKYSREGIENSIPQNRGKGGGVNPSSSSGFGKTFTLIIVGVIILWLRHIF